MSCHLWQSGDVVARMPPLHTSRFFWLVFLCNVLRALAKSIPDPGTTEVLIKVQVFDNSDLSPLKEATVQVYGNQSILASSPTGEDGVIVLTLQYRPGTWVIVAASKRGFVTNSAPWHASRIPLYASVSLHLLPQRPATLILYDDVVQLLLGSPGGRGQPWVQLQRKAVRPTLNASYATLSAMLTPARSQYEIGGFPYPLGLESNSTGPNSSWVELTAVGAVCSQLFGQNGGEVQVTDPVHISVPLPTNTPLKMATSVPVWRFEDRTGLWVKTGAGYIRQEGAQMTWSFVAPHLGYWLAAFPSTSGTALNPSGLRDITTYHTIFLLTILGSMALLVLVLLCLLLYYCRRRCLKPRRQRRKIRLSSTLESSKRDQGTSTSHLNLICSGPVGTLSSAGDADGVKSDLSSTRDLHSSRDDLFRNGSSQRTRSSKANVDAITRRGESFPMKATRSTNTVHSSAEDSDDRRLHHHHAKDNQGYSSDPPSPPPFAGHYQDHDREGKPPEYTASSPGDPLSRPSSMNTQPGQLIFCHSMEQMKESMYHSVVPTLVIPAHYMRLSSDLSAMEQAMERQQQLQHDMEGLQVSMTLPHQPSQHKHQRQQQRQVKQHDTEEESGQQGEAAEEHGWPSEPASGPVRIPVLFNDTTMAQMNGELQALTEKKLLELGVKPHPRAWFVSLDGRSNSLVRHSYIELGNEALRTPVGAAGVSQDPRADGREMKLSQRKGKESAERKAHGKVYSKLPVIDSTEPSSSSESHPATYSPEDNSLAPLLDEGPVSRGGTFPRRGRSQDNSTRSSTSEPHRDSLTSPDDEENGPDDKDEDGDNKKSPWQKREERPLMVFNVK